MKRRISSEQLVQITSLIYVPYRLPLSLLGLALLAELAADRPCWAATSRRWRRGCKRHKTLPSSHQSWTRCQQRSERCPWLEPTGIPRRIGREIQEDLKSHQEQELWYIGRTQRILRMWQPIFKRVIYWFACKKKKKKKKKLETHLG